MRISYSNILSNQSSIPDIFLNEDWKGMSIDEKKKLYIQFFI